MKPRPVRIDDFYDFINYQFTYNFNKKFGKKIIFIKKILIFIFNSVATAAGEQIPHDYMPSDVLLQASSRRHLSLGVSDLMNAVSTKGTNITDNGLCDNCMKCRVRYIK